MPFGSREAGASSEVPVVGKQKENAGVRLIAQPTKTKAVAIGFPPASANMLPLAGPKRKGLILLPVVSANMLPPLGVDKSGTELTVITHCPICAKLTPS